MTEKKTDKIITFYSYKGGTGRSMTLANVAWILACAGNKVLTIDWDLEAPGLHRYFYPFLIDKELTASDGLIDFVINYQLEAVSSSRKSESKEDWLKGVSQTGEDQSIENKREALTSSPDAPTPGPESESDPDWYKPPRVAGWILSPPDARVFHTLRASILLTGRNSTTV